MQPTFCLYQDSYFQKRSDIGSVKVWQVERSSEEERQWNLDALQESDRQTVWRIKYESGDNSIKRQSTSPVSCLTYGKAPPGYQEEVSALPLEPEEFYGVSIEGYDGTPSENLYFIIRLNDTGIPERLEYHLKNFLITNTEYIYKYPRNDLELY